MLDARLLYLGALAATILLGLLVLPRPPPAIAPHEAPRHEGQVVQVSGVALGASGRTGAWRFDVVRDGVGLPVRADVRPPQGAWVTVQGSVLRFGGALHLFADKVEEGPGPQPEPAALAAVAADPDAFAGRVVQVEGRLERGELRDGAGHAVRTGEGPWPDAGAVRAVGAIAYDARCLCHRIHAAAVQAL